MLKRIKKILKSKSLIGSLIFASALWTYTAFVNEYATFVSIPFEIKLPGNRGVENVLPKELSVEVQGKGWDLIDLYFFNTTAMCYIDLSLIEQQDDVYRISELNLLKGMRFFKNVDVVNVLPEAIEVKTGMLERKKIKIQPDIRVTPRDGYILIGQALTKPDSVEIYGNYRLVAGIDNWKTEPLTVMDLHSSSEFTVSLRDTLRKNIKLNIRQVSIKLDVQEKAEIVLKDIPVKVVGGELPKSHTIKPKFLSISVRGGMESIAALSPDDVKVWIEYNSVINDNTGILIPKITMPKNVILLSSDPQYIYHNRRSEARTLAQYAKRH